MVVGKKGIFFTIIAIFMLSTLFLSYSFYTEYRLRSKSLIIETRVQTMDSFITDLEKDLERGLFISSHRSILSLVQHITATGVYSNNVSGNFRELLLNGTLNGTAQDMMENTTLNDWMEKMEVQSNAINLIVHFDINSITLSMKDPWTVEVDLDNRIFVTDLLGIARWNYTKRVNATISIIGFEDPMYAVNTAGKVLNTINKTPYLVFVNGDDTTNLMSHTTNSYYVAWEMAPDFLMRLSGDMGTSSKGIESLVDLDELASQGIATSARSVVDYIYWSNNTATDYRINNTPSWFRLDDEANPIQNKTHLMLYQVNGSTI